MEKLTEKQELILDFIKKFKAERGFPPTIREICKALSKKSPATVHTHLNNLEKKGYIKKDGSKNRSIELLVKNNYDSINKNVVEIPILGKKNSSDPIEAIEMPSEYFSVPATIIPKNKDVFALKIKDDSMVNAGIFEGDTAIAQVQKSVKDGDMVVAMTEKKEIIVRIFYRAEKGVRLQPKNENVQPIIGKKITILGKIIGLYRKI